MMTMIIITLKRALALDADTKTEVDAGAGTGTQATATAGTGAGGARAGMETRAPLPLPLPLHRPLHWLPLRVDHEVGGVVGDCGRRARATRHVRGGRSRLQMPGAAVLRLHAHSH